MAEVKSAQADSFIQRPDRIYGVFLLYGPDAGMVSERADILSSNFGIDGSDPLALLRLDADAACSEPGKLVDEVRSIGMFGGKRIVRISGSTKRNLAEALRPVLDFGSPECRVIIEAGDIKRDSALRKLVERSKTGMAIPCYADDERGLGNLIAAELQAAGLLIDQEAMQLLRSNLGGDRKLTKAELEKLILYCIGQSQVTARDVEAIIGNVSDAELDEVVDAAITGKLGMLEAKLTRVLANSSPELPLIWAMRHFQMLQLARHRVEQEKLSAETIISAIRPPVNFKRRTAITEGLRLWNLASINRALVRLNDAVLDARASASLSEAICSASLLAIANEATRLRRRI
jgi:DNA polymerase III subunit delta